MANEQNSNIHAGHRKRLRNEFVSSGGTSFNEIRLLELLLTYAIDRIDVNPLAHRLLNEFGSLKKVLSASVDELKHVQGVDEYTAILIRLVSEINIKAFDLSLQENRMVISGTDKAAEVIWPFFSNSSEERFMAFYLDSCNRLITSLTLSKGNVNSVSVDIRKLVSECLNRNCSSVIIAHNHPDGNCNPSQADIDLTERINSTLLSMDIRLLDHIIVSGKDFLSFANTGLI